jgi:hypothetical protein
MRPRTKNPSPARPGWRRWSTELPVATLPRLKARAALEDRPMCEVLVTAIERYLGTAVPPRSGR